MCTVVLPTGVNPAAVNKYINNIGSWYQEILNFQALMAVSGAWVCNVEPMIHFSSSTLCLHSVPYFVGTTLSATESYQKVLNLSDPPTTRYCCKRGKGGSTFHRMEYTGRRVGDGCLRECCRLREDPVAKVL